jgi:hypothetical protein
MTMPSISYDASRDALLRPALRETVFPSQSAAPALPALCAELSRLAYLQFESDPAAKSSLDDALARVGLAPARPIFAPGTHTQAFATRGLDGRRIVVFRGTEPDAVGDIGTDLLATLVSWPHGGKVHRGFARAYASVQAEVDRWLDAHDDGTPPVFTGHSLGAALATLAASHRRAAVLVTFGSPRVGDDVFVAGMSAIDTQRHVNCCDIVTSVPPSGLWYRHVEPMCYIDRHGALRPDITPTEIETDRAAARTEYLKQGTWVSGNVLLRDLADHAPINYVRALID